MDCWRRKDGEPLPCRVGDKVLVYAGTVNEYEAVCHSLPAGEGSYCSVILPSGNVVAATVESLRKVGSK